MGNEFKIKITCDAGEVTAGAQKTANSLEDLSRRVRSLAASYKDDLDPGVKSFTWNGNKAAETAEGLTFKKTDLKKIVKELGHEFPLLGQAMRVALSPVVGTAAVLVAVFGVVRKIFDDIRERSNTGIFAGSLRANIEETTKAATESELAFRSFERALATAAGAQQTLKDKTDAAVAAIRAQGVATAELDNAQKAVELARVNMQEAQGKVSGPEAVQKRMEIEDRYTRKKLDNEVRTKEAELNAKRAEQERARQSGNLAQVEAEDAKKQADEAEARLANYNAFVKGNKAGLVETRKQIKALKGATFHGPGWETQLRSAQALEEQFQGNLDRLDPNMGTDLANEAKAARERQKAAEGRALGFRAEEAGLKQSIPIEQAAANQSYIDSANVAAAQRMGRTFGAATEAAQTAAQLSEEVSRAVQAGTGISVATLQKLKEWTAWQAKIERDVKALRVP